MSKVQEHGWKTIAHVEKAVTNQQQYRRCDQIKRGGSKDYEKIERRNVQKAGINQEK